MSEDPRKPLLTIARINMVLGVATAVRVLGELVQPRIGGDPWYLVILILDVPVALLWVAAGSELRINRAVNLVPTIVAASIAMGDSLAGATFLGPVLADFVITEPVGLRTGGLGSRLLLYAVQLVYSPIVLAVVLRDDVPRGIPKFYDETPRRSLILLGLGTTVAAAVILGTVKYWWSRG